VKRIKTSSNRDTKRRESLKRDAFTVLGQLFRTTREQKGLTQKSLAEKLGLRQRQISDLERSAMDPRFSTVQDVARALELEVALIPRHLVSVVDGLQRTDRGAGTPMYGLDLDVDLEDVDERDEVDRRKVDGIDTKRRR
jgi:transcriptional regulator with XRE-family HTH domain